MNEDLEIKEFSEEYIDDVLSLLDRTPTEFSRGYWKWKYRDTPSNQLLIAQDSESEGLAGYYAVVNWPIIIGMNKINSVQSVDTIVNPNYRRRGIMYNLGMQSYSNAKANGAKLIIGWTLGKHAAWRVFVHKLGWRDIGVMQVFVYPILPFQAVRALNVGFLRRLVIGTALWMRKQIKRPKKPKTKNLRVTKDEWHYTAMAKCWNSSRENEVVSVYKGPEFYKERFSQAIWPNSEFFPIIVWEKSDVVSFAVCIIKSNDSNKEGIIADIQASSSNKIALRLLVSECISIFEKRGAAFIRLWARKPSWMIDELLKAGMIERGRNMRFIIKVLDNTDPLIENALDFEKWDLSFCDSDHV